MTGPDTGVRTTGCGSSDPLPTAIDGYLIHQLSEIGRKDILNQPIRLRSGREEDKTLLIDRIRMA